MTDEAVKLGERYELLPDSTLPTLNSPGGSAYAARALRDKRLDPFVLVCSGVMQPRSDAVSAFGNIDHPMMVRLLDWGVVDWPLDRARRYCLIFEKPAGRRLMNALNEHVDPIPEEHLTRNLLQPMVGLLRELSGRGLAHGAIRPTNLFHRDQTLNTLILGEGASTPPGYAQPVLLETIERGMATPAGRGPGTTADDLYSLGVTLLILLLGRVPAAALDDDTLVQAKIERGSFPALVGQVRLPLGIGELIRGLLVDDPKQRWTLQDLDLWLSGRRLSPKQPQVPKRAARPMEFQGQDYWHCRTLARAFAKVPSAATAIIENGELDKWLRRSLADEARAEAVNTAVQAAPGKGGPSDERLVSRVCMALDPAAPIRYRGRTIEPEGIGGALADAFLRGESPQPVAEMVSGQLPMFWASVQSDFRPEFVPMVQGLDRVRTLLDRGSPGQGVERVLYELNPTMPCLSPLVLGHYAVTPTELLRALDAKGAGNERHKEPIDRHVAAFLLAHHKRSEEVLFTQLVPSVEPMRRAIAALTILADVQTRTGTEPLPNLCAWMIALLEPAFRRFHSRPRQEEVRRQSDLAVQGGRLSDLLKIIDDPEALRRDREDFEAAQQDYQEASGEIETLRRTAQDREGIIRNSGRQVAAIVSSVVSTLLVAAIILFYTL